MKNVNILKGYMHLFVYMLIYDTLVVKEKKIH